MTPQTTHQPRQQVEVIPHGFAGGTTSTPAAAAAPPLAAPAFWPAVAGEVRATLSSWLR